MRKEMADAVRALGVWAAQPRIRFLMDGWMIQGGISREDFHGVRGGLPSALSFLNGGES